MIDWQAARMSDSPIGASNSTRMSRSLAGAASPRATEPNKASDRIGQPRRSSGNTVRKTARTSSLSLITFNIAFLTIRNMGGAMLPTDRLDYSAISERQPLALPDGARLAVWVIVNVEEWDAKETMPRTVLTPPAGGSPTPDIPNWAWHEYGNRVGFWRMLEVFDRFNIRAALAINGSAIQAYEPIVEAAMARNWEFMGHGFTQRNMQKEENESEDIRKTADVIAKATGKRPRGGLGPGLTETWATPDLLKE